MEIAEKQVFVYGRSVGDSGGYDEVDESGMPCEIRCGMSSIDMAQQRKEQVRSPLPVSEDWQHDRFTRGESKLEEIIVDEERNRVPG